MNKQQNITKEDQESWSKIKDLEYTKYLISTYGNIKNTETGYILEKNYKSGYPTVLITHEGISKTYKVHRLVGKTFLPNYDDKLVINHIDGDKANSKLSNLECISQSENMRHAYNTGLLVIPSYNNFEPNLADELDFIKQKSKPIPNYPNYSATQSGKIFSHKTKKYIRGQINNEGYIRLGLYGDNGEKKFLIHRLIAQTFIPNPENKPQVNHIDNNKSNNCVNNIEWISNQENRNHALRQYKTTSIILKNYSLKDYSTKDYMRVEYNIRKAKTEITILNKDLKKDNNEVAQIINNFKKNKNKLK